MIQNRRLQACSFPDGWVFDTQQKAFASSLGDDFHIWEVDWNEDRIIGKIDDETYFTRAIDPSTMDEFLKEFFLIFNVAMGGTLGSGEKPPGGKEVFPQTMLVDYVRVFQLDNTLAGRTAANPSGPVTQPAHLHQ